MSNRYLAITIGPIYKTFQNVRKTRELWAASYTFSYISKKFIEKIQTAYPRSLFIPHYDKNSPNGIGLYPDRIYLRQDATNALSIIESIKIRVLEEISGWLKSDDALTFLLQYFRIYTVEFSVKEGENPLVIANKILDVAELRSTWQLEETTNLLLHFFRDVNIVKVNDTKWIKGHFTEKDVFGQVRFESLPEISTRAIRKIKEDEYKSLVKKYCYTDRDLDLDDSFIRELQQVFNESGLKETFKNYHKYVCIIKADGDKVGKYLNAIDKEYESELSSLSRSLYNWGIESAELIKSYSGIPVYIGGDDLLFFAPVAGNNNQTIIDLTKNLNDCFKKHFRSLPERKDKEGKEIKPTLSFGISITYYKYPLYEALAKADALLYKSKETRNACSISLLKHSGSSFDITVSNEDDNPVTKAFFDVNNYFSDNTSFVSSIIHHFRENEGIYSIIGQDQMKVLHYLKNNFEDKKYKTFVESIAALCYAVYDHNIGAASREHSEKSIKELYSLLRILKFLNGQEDGK